MNEMNPEIKVKFLGEPEENQDKRIFSSFVEKVGSMGCYQRMLVIILSLVQYICGGLFLVAPFILYQEPYQCASSTEGLSCHDYVCSLTPSERLAFVPESSIKTITNDFGDFRCSAENITLAGAISLILFAKAAGALMMAIIGDRLSRKLLMILSQFLVVIGLAIALTGSSLSTIGWGLFFALAGIQNCFYLTFAILTEEVSEMQRSVSTVLIQMMFGLGMLMNVFWAFYLQNWKMLMFTCYFLPMLFMIVVVHVFVVDTPMDLVIRNCPQSALMSFEHQARLNGFYHNSTITLMEIFDLKDRYGEKMEKKNRSSPHFSFLDLIRFSSLKKITVLLAFMQLTLTLSFFGPGLILDKFSLNIYNNGLTIGISYLLAFPLCFYLINKVERKLMAYACFGVAAVCACFMSTSNETEGQGSFLVLVLLFIFRFAIAVEYTFLMVYLNELYPTQARMLGLTCFSLMGGIAMAYIPQLTQTCIQNGIPIMGCLAGLLLLCVYASKRLPETFGKDPEDEIYEMREGVVAYEMKRVSSSNNLRADNFNIYDPKTPTV